MLPSPLDRQTLECLRNAHKCTTRLDLINAASIANSLVLLNLTFAAQAGLDFIYLWSGADLPAGIRFATYTHSGAYPLVATALLRGLFALISRPFTDESDLLLLALAIWLGQTSCWCWRRSIGWTSISTAMDLDTCALPPESGWFWWPPD